MRNSILTYILYQYLCKRTKFSNIIRILYREITCCKFVDKKLVCQVFFWLPIKILEHSFLHCFVSENFKEKTSHLSSSASHPFSNQFPSSNDFPVLLSLESTYFLLNCHQHHQPTSKAVNAVTRSPLFNSNFNKPCERKLSACVKTEPKTLSISFLGNLNSSCRYLMFLI